jgi:ketosteroid isomerase-like protein
MFRRRYNPLMTRLLSTMMLLAGGLLAQSAAEWKDEVRRTETAFAKSMADRDLVKFTTFLSREAVFMSNGQPTRGPKEVSEKWKRFFEGPAAPFSWAPEFVDVLDSGTLALSSGPVRDPSGKRVGTFNSVWRREGDGQWKIVFDNGCPACNCEAK